MFRKLKVEGLHLSNLVLSINTAYQYVSNTTQTLELKKENVMKKSLAQAIALATVLGVSASAQAAISINPDGLGEVLLYSYYTAENDNQTVLNITNTTNVAKAVKVRFVEAQNSQDVLDFNLYLSPRDQWSGAVIRGEDGGAKLITQDRSCTAPVITSVDDGGTGIPFRALDYQNDRLTGVLNKGPLDHDGGAQGLDRTLTGHIEVIEMGTITDTGIAAAVTNAKDAGQAPANCFAIDRAFAKDGIWHEDTAGYNINTGLEVGDQPGGLYGTASILNTNTYTQVSYEPVALQGFMSEVTDEDTVSGVTLGGPLHAQTGRIVPGLNSSSVFAADLGGDDSAVEFSSSVEAISALLSKDRISNNYNLVSGAGAKTNWVVTFPTKRYHVDHHVGADRAVFTSTDADTYGSLIQSSANDAVAVAPFTTRWAAVESGAEYTSCHAVKMNAWDNEEYIESNMDFSPSLKGTGPELCYQTNLITFNGDTILGGKYVSNNVDLVQPDFRTGWMEIDFSKYTMTGQKDTANDTTVTGLPVIGFSVTTISNTTDADKVAKNYGTSNTHKATRNVAP